MGFCAGRMEMQAQLPGCSPQLGVSVQDLADGYGPRGRCLPIRQLPARSLYI